MAEVGVDSAANRWDEPLVLGMVDPHDSLSHPVGISDVQLESPTHLDPDQFTDFLIPSWFGAESLGSTKYNPFLLPEIYRASQKKKHSVLADIQQVIRDLQLDENQKWEACALHVHFKDWLYVTTLLILQRKSVGRIATRKGELSPSLYCFGEYPSSLQGD